MTQKETFIIDSLLNEDEKYYNDEMPEINEELSSWSPQNKQKGIKREIKKICSPGLPISSSITKWQGPEKLLLPKLNTVKIENDMVLIKRSPQCNRVKPKASDKILTISELKSVEHLLLNVREKPHRTKFRYSNVLKLKINRNKQKERNSTPFPFSLDLPEKKTTRSYFEGHVKSKSVLSNNYPSAAYEKFFISSNSSNTLKPKSTLPERIKLKYNLSKFNDFPNPSKKLYLKNLKSKSQTSEKYKIKKKFLLAPIFQNICKYNFVLK